MICLMRVNQKDYLRGYLTLFNVMSNRKEELILRYLERTYGNRKLFENDTSYSISGVCIYFKSSKQVGWLGTTHLDLVNWFGDGKYYSVMQKWFYKKYNLGS